MTSEKYKTSKGVEQFRAVLTDSEALKVIGDANRGFCLACGSEAYGVEPDAQGYTCECCGLPKVYGMEELLMMGLIKLVSDPC